MRTFVPFGFLVLVTAFGAGILLVPKADTAEPLAGGSFLPARPAPDFHLTDQFGRSISLARLHGHPVLLTFLWTHGTQVDPVVAETRRSMQFHGRIPSTARGNEVVMLDPGLRVTVPPTFASASVIRSQHAPLVPALRPGRYS